MASPAVLGALLGWGLALCCLCAAGAPRGGRHPWTKLILSQHWPPTVCKDLLPEMKEYWPDVIHPSSNPTQFWRHEWEKHGTCAAQLDTLNSEKKYFGKTLALYKRLDLNRILYSSALGCDPNLWANDMFKDLVKCNVPGMLLKFMIKPSIKHYLVSDFLDALTRIYGVVPKIKCLPPEQDEQVQTIGQIELCFTKEDLKLRNCTESGEQEAQLAKEAVAKEAAAAHGMADCELGFVVYPPPANTNFEAQILAMLCAFQNKRNS